MKKLEVLIQEFNKNSVSVKLEKEPGGIAKIVSSDPMMGKHSKIVLGDGFHKEIKRISQEHDINVVLNQMNTVLFIQE